MPTATRLHPSNPTRQVDGALGTVTDFRFRWAAISLDAVSVRIDDEGGAVIGAVSRAQTGRTAVQPAGAQRQRVKRIDGVGVRCPKADVKTRFFVGRYRA